MSTIHDKMSAVADAIREKTGGTELLTLDDMAIEIAGISTGVETGDATAVAGHILENETAYVNGVKVTGTMLNRNIVGKNGAIGISDSYPTIASNPATNAALQINTNLDGVKRLSIKPDAGFYDGYHYASIPASDLGDANANQVLSGATFTSSNGLKMGGTIPSKAAATITPSISNQTIAAGTYLSGIQTIAGDADLVAGNIKKGINIFGVDGNYEGIELNFDVVGGTTQPSSAKENTIWIDTDVDITAYHFSSEPISTNLDYSNLTNANDVISGRGDNGENFYGSLPIMWSKTYLFKTKLIAGVTYKLDSTGLGYGRIGAFSKLIRDDNDSIRIEGADPLSLLSKNRRYSIFTPIETTDAYFYYCTDADNTGSNPAFSVWFALYLVGNPIWISTGASGNVEFNALKKNGIQVYPISAKQYINNAWVDKEAKTYQNGKWVGWTNYLYNQGDQCSSITGGWKSALSGGISVDLSGAQIVFSVTSSTKRDASVYTNNKIDVTNYKSLIVRMTAAKGASDYSGWKFQVGISSANTAYKPTFTTYTQNNSSVLTDVKVDISGITGSYYVAIYSDVANGTIDKVWLV
jgi:hypothetical protein